MNTLKLIAIGISAFLITADVSAKISDPSEIAENSHVTPSTSGILPTWNSIKETGETIKENVREKVSSFWQSAKETLRLAPKSPKTMEPKKSEASLAVQPEPETQDQKQKAVAELEKTLGDFKAQVKGIETNQLQNARDSIKEGLTQVQTPGQAPSADLKKTKSGVPQFEVLTSKKGEKTQRLKIAEIPKLSVGLEPKISRRDFELPKIHFALQSASHFKPLKSDAVTPAEKIKTLVSQPLISAIPVMNAQQMRDVVPQPVSLRSVADIKWTMQPPRKLSELQPIRELSVNELKMLSALILIKKPNQCPFVAGIFEQLSGEPSFKVEAMFHLGICSARLGLKSSAFNVLSEVIRSESPDYATQAISELSKDLSLEFEARFFKVMNELKNKSLIDPKDLNQVNYLLAKGAFKSEAYEKAKLHAKQVPEKSSSYLNAQYIVAIAEYALGNVGASVTAMESLRQRMQRIGSEDKNLNSLTALNLARIKFNQAKYKEALELYLKIDKDHPSWVQALIETGWTQLNMQDYPGAIGNMYSLHSPYFSSVYKPDSFVVRTVGYLNICQYADAYRTLSKLESDYRKYMTAAKSYSSKMPVSAHHATIIKYLKGKSDADVDGLPFQVIREMARQKEFLNWQGALNGKVGEGDKLIGIAGQMDEEAARTRGKLAKTQERFKHIENQIEVMKKTSSVVNELGRYTSQLKIEKDLIIAYKYRLLLLELSKKGYVKFKERSVAAMEKEKSWLKTQAAETLASTLKRMVREMSQILDNNEFLRYEVFSGSGENIRYQVAGGQVKGEVNRVPAHVQPSKSLNWSFDGEYWEDEIGSYRSSLQNLCPKSGHSKKEPAS